MLTQIHGPKALGSEGRDAVCKESLPSGGMPPSPIINIGYIRLNSQAEIAKLGIF